MIIDTLQNFEKYISINPLFDAVAEFLKTILLTTSRQANIQF